MAGIFDFLGAIGLVATGAKLGSDALGRAQAQGYVNSMLAKQQAAYERGEMPKTWFLSHHLKPYSEEGVPWDGYRYRYYMEGKWWGEIYTLNTRGLPCDSEEDKTRSWWQQRHIHERNCKVHPESYL